MSDRVHWFVPTRKVVVRGSLTMGELIGEWVEEIEARAEALLRWYSMDPEELELGLTDVSRWLATSMGVPIPVVRDGELVFDEPTFHFRPRLWKGPARVLLEQRQGPPPVTLEEIFDPTVTEGRFALSLSEDREVEDPNTLLLMGDVLELPLHKLLAACGLEAYGSYPTYDDVYRFRAEGSYLLGTSLREDGVEDPPLPDNRVGLRFQLALGLFHCSFVHDRPVYAEVSRAVPFAATPALSDAPAPTPPEGPVEEPETPLDQLRQDLAELLAPVDTGNDNVYLRQIESIDGIGDVRERVESYARAGKWEGKSYHPARSIPYILRHAVMEVYDGGSLDDLGYPELARIRLLMQHHDRIAVAFRDFARELPTLMGSPGWIEHREVGPSLQSHEAEGWLEEAAELLLPERIEACDDYGCGGDEIHARVAISKLILALREKKAALDKVKNPELVEIEAADLGPGVYARGLVYCGTPWGPCDGESDDWRWYTSGWGRTSDSDRVAPANLPTAAGLKKLVPGLPVTPGTVCSPATLWLSNYMLRNHTKTWGSNAVSSTAKKGDPAVPLTRHMSWHHRDEIAELAPVVTAESRIERLEAFLTAVRDLYAELSERPRMFWAQAFEEARGQQSWESVSSSTTEALDKWADQTAYGWRAPCEFVKRLSTALTKASGSEREALVALHDRLIEGCEALLDRWEALLESEDWAAFADVGAMSGSSRAKYFGQVAGLRPTCGAGGFVGSSDRRKAFGQGLHGMNRILYYKKQGMEKLEKKKDKIKDQRGGSVALTDYFSDVNALSFGVHEVGVVKIYPPERLLEEELDSPGFMIAFDPLSGEPQAAPSMTEGQLCIFEATGAYPKPFYVNGKRHRQYGTDPFVWRRVERNRFTITFEGPYYKFDEYGRTGRGKLRSVSRLNGPGTLAEAHAEGPAAARPIYIRPSPKSGDKALNAERALAEARIRTNGHRMYASRALPFPTLEEARGAFPDYAEVAAHLAALNKSSPD